MLAGGRPATPPTRAVAPRRPRPGPPRASTQSRRPASAGAAAAQPRRRRRGRLLAALLALLVIAVAVVAIVLATTPAPTRVVLRNVVYRDVHQASAALRQLISENTQ